MSIIDYDFDESDEAFANRIVSELDEKLSTMTENERKQYFKKRGFTFCPTPKAVKRTCRTGTNQQTKVSLDTLRTAVCVAYATKARPMLKTRRSTRKNSNIIKHKVTR